MNCREINRKMLHYIDNELPHDTMEGFAIHLDNCNDCKSGYVNIKRIYSTIDKDQVKIDHPYFYTRVEAGLQKLRESESTPLFRVRPAVLILAVVLPLLAGIWLGYSSFRQDIGYVDSNELIADVNNYLSTPGYPATDYYSVSEAFNK